MNRYPFRYVLELAVGLAAVVFVVETCLVMGLVAPMAVSGSSMAPTLRGPHRWFHCPDCRGEFSVGLDEDSEDPRAFCPACGSRRAMLVSPEVQAGDRLRINRAAFAWRTPRRWEVVVFHSPQQHGELSVKRVVGMPGEKVSLVDGDVLVDGRLVCKSLAEQQALRQLVFRSSERADLTKQEGPAWQIRLLPRSDVMLTSRVQLADDGKLRMTIDNERGRFEMAFDAVTDEICVLHDGRPLRKFRISSLEVPIGSDCEWIFSLFDGQALVAVDGYELLKLPLLTGAKRQQSTQPSRLVAAIYGSGGTIAEPAVWQDAYYEYRYGDRRPEDSSAGASTEAPDPAATPTWQLGPREYFVLGDHAEISDDSRSWLAGPGLDAKLLIGKPLGVR